MQEVHYVKVTVDVDCDWDGATAPGYRLFVNNELLNERLWRWTDKMLCEVIPLAATAGEYTISLEPVGNVNGKFTLTNLQVIEGPGEKTADMEFRVQ